MSDTIEPDEKLTNADEGRKAEDLPVVAPRPMTQNGGFVTLIQAAVDLQSAPEDLRELLEALAAEGISATLPTAGPDDPLHEPLVVRTSLSAAIIEERD